MFPPVWKYTMLYDFLLFCDTMAFTLKHDIGINQGFMLLGHSHSNLK